MLVYMASYNKPKQVNGEINPIYNPDDYNTVPSFVRIDNQATNYINNNPFKKIKLSSTWVAYGDSFTAGPAWNPTWCSHLQDLTGKTVINKSKGGSTTDYMNRFHSNDFIRNPAYANYSSILMYGFNDVRNNKPFYSNSYIWTQSVLSTVLGLSIPQNRIHDPRNSSWIKTGTWINTSAYNYGIYTVTGGNYIQKNVGNARYIVVRHSMTIKQCLFSVYVNGIHKNSIRQLTPLEAHNISKCVAYIIDLGEEIENCTIKVQNDGLTGETEFGFIDFVAAWTDADLINARSVLLLSIPRFSFDLGGADPFNAPTDEKRMLMNEGLEQVALICTRIGLPVSFFKISEIQANYYNDSLHPATTMGKQWAKQILDHAIY